MKRLILMAAAAALVFMPSPVSASTGGTVVAVHNCQPTRCTGGTWTFSGFPAGSTAMVTSGGARRYVPATGSAGVGACPRTQRYCNVGTGFAMVWLPDGTQLGPFADNGAPNAPVTYQP